MIPAPLPPVDFRVYREYTKEGSLVKCVLSDVDNHFIEYYPESDGTYQKRIYTLPLTAVRTSIVHSQDLDPLTRALLAYPTLHDILLLQSIASNDLYRCHGLLFSITNYASSVSAALQTPNGTLPDHASADS